MQRASLAAALVALALTGGSAAAERVQVVAEWPGDLDGAWQRRDFVGMTRYAPADTDRPAIRAVAERSASALYREIEIDITRTPYLQWSWRVDRLPTIEHPESEKAGDDYGARIYIVREGLFGKWSAKALNYVWSQRQPVGTSWPNAYTGRARMRSVERGSDRLGEWVTYTRDVRADWAGAFGERLERIHGVALMTDADDSGSSARANYGMIRFCATPQCTGE